MDKMEADEKFAKAGKPHDFVKYHKLPDKLTAVGVECRDQHNKFHRGPADKNPTLQKELWQPYWLTEAKKYKDDFVYD